MLPQPVYMNMGDLAQMAAAKARSSPAIIDEANEAMEDGGEESPELKTPTAEHQGMIPGGAASHSQAVATTKVEILILDVSLDNIRNYDNLIG